MSGAPLTGHWKLNKELCTPQSKVLQLMGRKPWEVSVIDKADEDFNLFHFRRPTKDGGYMHFFEKHVTISLDSKILKLLSAVVRIEFDKVKYTHRLTANNIEVKHLDDEKRFGECKSRTTWEKHANGKEGFAIHWFLKNGILKVFHFINDSNQLQIEMEMFHANSKTAKCIKIYDRHEFTAEMQNKLDQHEYKAMLVV